MKQEDKELLLKDLCARLPYGVRCIIPCEPNVATVQTIDLIYLDGCVIVDYSNSIDSHFPIVDIRPYLRPMSSMTEEEAKYISSLKVSYGKDTFKWIYDNLDYLNSRYFDYRNLIEKGLALEAPEGMYNIKEE